MPADAPNPPLRPEEPGDEAFLRALFDSTRGAELAASGLPAETLETLLQMQFKAQQQGYRASFPDGEFLIVLLRGKPAGRMVIHRGPAAWALVDIALLPEHRGQGIGTALIQKLCAEAAAAGRPLQLSVIKGARPARLYQRLGFVKIGESGPRDWMEWRAVCH